MYNDITGVILAGGSSSRMGVSKSFLTIGSQTVIEKISLLMKSLFPVVLLSTNTPEEYAALGLPCIADEYKNAGPLAGIHSGLVHSSTSKIFVISCDVPLMRKDVIEFLIHYPTACPIIVAKADGFIQQLCGIYSKSLLPAVEKILRASTTFDSSSKRSCSVLELVKTAGAEIIDIEKVYSGYVQGTFANMNNQKDYEEILVYMKGRNQ